MIIVFLIFRIELQPEIQFYYSCINDNDNDDGIIFAFIKIIDSRARSIKLQ